jgi:hypothetical protein
VAGPGAGATLEESDLGQVVAQVKYRVDGNVCDPNYRPKDGDAAFLDPGTLIYEVKGHPTSEMLAARRNGQIALLRIRAGSLARFWLNDKEGQPEVAGFDATVAVEMGRSPVEGAWP